ncbi:MAG: restriction endonuclease subunit S, partial [Sphaerospermopsis kisseleviana]
MGIIANIRITFPPLEEQEKIARFLDYKTKQIDELIAKKETLIEKLDEKRTSLISHAVTKGLDVNVSMKDSGIEWLGAIPEHWEVKSLRHICEFLNRRRIPLSSEHRGSMSNKIYPYYGASGIIDYV